MRRLIITELVISIIFLICVPLSAEKDAISAKSAIVIEATTGIVLYEKDPDTVRPMASTTKIMTAMLAIENGALDDVYTVSAAAEAVAGSQLGLLAGQRISLEDLLYMLMLKSGNDAAVTIAEGIAGSESAFVAMMNAKAAQIGCANTCFMNSNGMPAEGHHTTARELAMIAAEAYKNEVFRGIVSTKIKRLDSYFGLSVKNSNKLLTMYEYACGMKTGFTKEAGRCLVSAAEKDGVTLIIVTLGDPNDWDDHIKLFDACFACVEKTVLFDTGKYTAVRSVLNGDTRCRMINNEPIYGLAISGKKINFEYRENISPAIFAPITAGETCGSVSLYYNGKKVSEYLLSAAETVAEKEIEVSVMKIFLIRLRNFIQKII